LVVEHVNTWLFSIALVRALVWFGVESETWKEIRTAYELYTVVVFSWYVAVVEIT